MVVPDQHDAVQILGELRRIRVRRDLPDFDGFAERPRDDVYPLPLQLDQAIPHGTWAVIELARRGDENTPTWQSRVPGQPPLEQRAQAWDAAWLRESRAHHVLGEAGGAVLEHLELQPFLRLEMRKQPALG